MLPLLVLGSQHVAAQEVLPDDFVVETYVSGIDAVKMAWTPDQQWMYIGSKDGRVYLAKNGELVPGTFMDIRDEVNTRGDRGMLGLAVHPEFPTKNWVYLLYTYDPPETFDQADPAAANGGPGQRVARLIRVTADPATDYESHIPGSEVVILGTASTWENIGDPTAEQDEPDAPWSCGQRPAYVQDCLPSDGLSHSIGNVEFGSDGMLYVSVGDSATWSTVDPKATRSLDVDSLGGKILRIDPETGAGLPDNPFFDGDPTSNRSRVLHLGLRNPFRFTVTDDGEVWIGDVGWEKWEEVNHGEPGADFGWPCYEGDDLGSAEQPGYAALDYCKNYYNTRNATAPVYSWIHEPGIGGCAIGGPIYDGLKWPREYHDKLIVGECAFKRLEFLDISGPTATLVPFATDIWAVDMSVGPDGDIYFADSIANEIKRIVFTGVPETVPRVIILSPVSGTLFSQALPVEFSASASDLEDDDAVVTAGLVWTSSLDGAIGTGGTVSAEGLSEGTHVITVTVTDSDGNSSTDTVTIDVTSDTPPTATITMPADGGNLKPGDIVEYAGSATDAEDGQLSGLSLSWEGIIHHNTHEHGDYFNANGASGSVEYPDHDDDSYLQICLTATDSAGLTAVDCVDLFPRFVNYTFESVPPGINLTYNSFSAAAPFMVLAAAGGARQISAPTPQDGWIFESWSIGGPATQTITIEETDQTLVATFNALPEIAIALPVSESNFPGGATVEFSAWASDFEDDDALLSASISWSSNLDGDLGTGADLSTSTLSDGTHTITASVTDSGGLSAQAVIVITVGDLGWTSQARYRADFQGTAPAAGWSYLWNSVGPIGDAANYVSLLWNGGLYDSDGAGARPDPTENAYGALTVLGGHPGMGADQGAADDRYVIAAYSPSVSGPYRLSDSFVRLAGCEFTNGISVEVYKNNEQLLALYKAPGAGDSNFDVALGDVVVGDTIYVAVGPNSTDGCDGFEMDFSIQYGEQADFTPTVEITAPSAGDGFVSGATVTFSATASDVEDDDQGLTSAISWSSSLDGDLGSGPSLSVATLSDGAHVIRASVNDSFGHTGVDQVEIFVGNDSDGDGVPDSGDAFPEDPSEWADSDGDGVGDNSDAFPNDPTETSDADGDGVGDNSDVFPNDPSEWADSDGDGVGDNSDAFPNDPNETADSDGDGIGDNSDPVNNLLTPPSSGGGGGGSSGPLLLVIMTLAAIMRRRRDRAWSEPV